MASYTIVTTDEQEAALAWQYDLLLHPPATMPPTSPPPATQADYLQQLVSHQVLDPMVVQYGNAQAAQLVSLVATIPPENRAAAFEDIEVVVDEHGGTPLFRDVPYLWSVSTAPPPRVNSIEVDVTQPNMATVSKIFFDDRDAGNVVRMDALMAIRLGSTLRLANGATLLRVRTTAAPIQRQGADGHVEIAVQLVEFVGTFADLQQVSCSVE
jgi:hypothetical protein